jgi:putative hydroxymethylpyrimidine transport system permease protein
MNMLRGIITILCFILFWLILVRTFALPAYILPGPEQVIIVLMREYPVIMNHLLPTIVETLSGLVLGILFGCLGGIIVAFFQPLNRFIFPILIISQAIPIFAIAPLLVIWLGFGLASKIVTTIIMIFFPITSAFYDGLRNTNSGFLDLAKTMNGSRWNIFYYIQIPAAFPALCSGIRIAAVIAPIGAIVGEWVGSSQGLGYLMLNANARMQIDMMFAALIAIIIMSLLLYFSIDKLLQKILWW